MVPLSRPLFDGFGLDVSSEKGQKESSGEAGSIEVDVSSQVQKPSKAGKLTSKKMSCHVNMTVGQTAVHTSEM